MSIKALVDTKYTEHHSKEWMALHKEGWQTVTLDTLRNGTIIATMERNKSWEKNKDEECPHCYGKPHVYFCPANSQCPNPSCKCKLGNN
jgi:hypothetical protein